MMASTRIEVGQLIRAKIPGGSFRAGDTFVVHSVIEDDGIVKFVACKRPGELGTLYFRPDELTVL